MTDTLQDRLRKIPEGWVDTAIGIEAAAHINALEKALRDIADTNGGSPLDRNNRMKRIARAALGEGE